jgi:hypothetical protein
MKSDMTRRNVLRMAIAASASPLAMTHSHAAAAEKVTPAIVVPETDQLTSYLNGGHLLLRWNNFVVASYRANPLQKYPYCGDLAGPLSGLPLTTESSVPFPHHRGIWLGCEPLCGGDYWHGEDLGKGQIRSLGLSLVNQTTRTAEFVNHCQWARRDAESPFLDERRVAFSIMNDRTRLLDFDVRLTALQDLQIAKAKHSFFALRVAPDLSPTGGGTLINSAGDVGEAGTYGKPASWCGYFGRRALRPDVIEGLAMMDHPANPWAPCPWFTRDYGHLSPSPFNFLERPWELEEQESIRLRYRVVLHAGDLRTAGLDQIYKDWIATS